MKWNFWCSVVSVKLLICVLCSLFNKPLETSCVVTEKLIGLRVDPVETNCVTTESNQSASVTNRLSASSKGSSTSSRSSVSCLESVLSQCRATGRIKKEVKNSQFSGASKGQNCLKQLTKNLSAKLNNLELLEGNSNRPSVITPNPTPPNSPRLQRASTPSSLSLPVPSIPRNCISENCLPPHSPTCSEISSIGGEPFEEEEVPLAEEFDQVEPILSPNFETMDQAEALVVRKMDKILT